MKPKEKMSSAEFMQSKYPQKPTPVKPAKGKRVNKPSQALIHGAGSSYRFIIGIDPGYRLDRGNTGLSVHTGATDIKEIGAYFAWEAINVLQSYLKDFPAREIAVVLEDPKTWTQFRRTSNETADNRKASKGGLQAIFNMFYSFCRVNKIDCYPVPVQGDKIYDEAVFRQIFGWHGKPCPPKDAMAAATFVLRSAYLFKKKVEIFLQTLGFDSKTYYICFIIINT